jgi:hypothetical protein
MRKVYWKNEHGEEHAYQDIDNKGVNLTDIFKLNDHYELIFATNTQEISLVAYEVEEHHERTGINSQLAE